MNNNRTSGIPHAMQLYVSLIRTQMTRGEIPIQCIIVAMILELRQNVFGFREEQMDGVNYCANYFGIGHTL